VNFDLNPYYLLAINGFCTGMGVVSAQWFYDRFIKRRLDVVHKRAKGLFKKKKKRGGLDG